MNPDESKNGIARRNLDAPGDYRALSNSREPRFAFSQNGEFEGDDSQQLGPGDYLAMVRERLWLISVIAVVATALVAVYVARQPNVYQAEATIQVDLENNPGAGPKSSSVIIDSPGDNPAYFNTQLLLLKSPSFLRRVAKTLDAEGDRDLLSERGRSPAGSLRNLWRKASSVDGGQTRPSRGESLRATTIAPASPDGNISEAQQLESYVNIIRDGLDVKLTESSRLININFNHGNPAAAAKVANVIADTFVQSNMERRGDATSTASQFLQTRIAELQSKIAENERRLIDYAKEHQILPLDSGRDIEADRLAALDKGLTEAQTQRKQAEAEYQAALAPGAAAALVEASNNAQFASLSSRISELRQRREVLLLETGQNWPEVKELNQQITDLEKDLKDAREHAIAVVLTNLETRYRQALTREQGLRKDFDQQHSVTLAQDAAGIDYRMIQQETTIYKGLLENLQQRSKENDVVLAATPNNVHVIDYATLPARFLGPKRLTIVAIAFLTSLAIGIGLAILLGSIDGSVRINSVERVEKLFGLPVVAVLPSALSRRRLLGRFRRRNALPHAALLLNQRGRTLLADAYQKLRTSLTIANSANAPKIMLITSTMPGEGKTTAAINTGLVMSQTCGKVLLIDADLRNPGVHELLGLKNEHGLSSLLSNGHTEADAIGMIEQFQDTGLYILPSGPWTDNPAELLASERMKRLVDSLRSQFSYVIIDSPPISFFTDAVLVSSMVDGVLLVVRGPKTPQHGKYSVYSLDNVGAPILGVVLNDVSLDSTNYRYYRNYYGSANEPSGSTAQLLGIN